MITKLRYIYAILTVISFVCLLGLAGSGTTGELIDLWFIIKAIICMFALIVFGKLATIDR